MDLTPPRRSKFLKPSDSNSDHLRNPSTTSETAEMSCSLPQEILDHIIDHLHDQPEALKACSLVSKAWIYRTRRYIFNHIEFSSRSRHVSHWQETFPDLATSPAHNTRLLSISLTKLISPAEADTLRTFRCVSHLNVDTTRWYDQLSSLAPLRGLSPVVRSLCLSFAGLPSSEIFGLVCSFPLLEDLALVGYIGRKRDEVWDTPSTLPKLTGSLDLPVGGGVQTIARRLLDLPDGLRFKKISVQWSTMESITPTINLVSGCSDTLESLTITNYLKGLSAKHIYQGFWLTATHRRSRNRIARPVQCNETQRCSISVQSPQRSMDHRGTIHCGKQQLAKRVVGAISPGDRRCLDFGRGSTGMAGSRPSTGENLDFPLAPPQVCARVGGGRVFGWSCVKIIARIDEEGDY